jgi:hypothetical protein
MFHVKLTFQRSVLANLVKFHAKSNFKDCHINVQSLNKPEWATYKVSSKTLIDFFNFVLWDFRQ